jgi:hypothetical protein
MANSRGSLKRLWGWIKEQIVQDVPEYLATCEFDCACVHECRQNQCTLGEWEKRKASMFGAVQFITAISALETERSNRHTTEAHSVS